MVRHYKRKTERGANPKNLHAALELVKNGKSIRSAAKLCNVNFCTLSRAMKRGANTACGYSQHHRVFTDNLEIEVADYLLTCSTMNHGLTTFELRKLAYQFSVSNKLKMPASWIENSKGGKDWMLAFLKRHPRLSVRKPEATSLARATSFNRQTVSEFFENLKNEFNKHKFPSDRIYNMDETAITTVHTPPKIIAQKNAKQVAQVTSAERGILVTGICCVSASGNSVPPAFVWPRKTNRNTAAYMRGTMPGSLGMNSSSGWLTEENFCTWMEHFILHAKPSPSDSILLLLDNHHSHLAVNAINRAKESGVILLAFPPHTTNKLQPLDVSVYGPLKNYYNAACNSWQVTNPGKTIGLYDVGELASKSIVRTLTPENITAGYRKTGIYPLDTDIFQDSDFLPAYVTDRPLTDCNQLVTTATADNDICIEQTMADEAGCSAQIESTPSTSYVYLSKKRVTPADIRPYPKAPPRQQASKGRKRSRSAVLTATPIKQRIEREAEARKLKHQPKTSKRKLVRVQSETEDEDEPEVVSDSESPDEDTDLDHENKPQTLNVGAFVVVRYAKKHHFLNYVARIENIVDNGVDVCFYKRSGDSFILPENEESDTVDRANIYKILPPPKTSGGTARVALKLKFDVALDEVAKW